MTRFANVLQEVEDRLITPEPARTRILLEMAADLEDSYDHHRAQGLEEAEATRRAEEAFAISDETLRLLERMYQPAFSSPLDRFIQQAGTLWSTTLLMFLLVFEIFLASRISANRSLFVDPSPFLWLIVALAVAAIAFTIWKLVQIFSVDGRDVRRLRAGLGVPLFFAGLSIGIAFFGFLFHLQRYFRANASGAPETLFMNFAGWMASISSLMTIGLLTAILAGMVWFALSSLVLHSEAREMARLLKATG